MITSLFPSVFPAATPAIATNEPPPAEKTGEVLVEKSTNSATDEAGRTHRGHHHHHDHDRFRESERSDLFHTAKHMIKDAFRHFRHDIRDSFQELGFDGGIAKKIAKGVVHGARDALRSGVDFSAKLMVAAISQVSGAGASSSFNMVAHSIEVNINHTTGSVDVNMLKVSIEGQTAGAAAGEQPHLLDISDSGQDGAPGLSGLLLALQDLMGIFGGEEEVDGETPEEVAADPVVEPVALATAREAVDNPLGESADTPETETATARTAVDAVLASAATDEAAPVEKTDETDVVEEAAEETETAEETAPALPEIVTPLLINNQDYRARIFITAFERSVNDRSEQITFMRFDAIIPLSTKPAGTTTETQSEPAATETPAVETLEEEKVATVA